MYITKTGGLYGEVGRSMGVTDECSNTGEIMGIENRGGRAPFCWNGGMRLGAKGEAPELGTSGFSTTMEDARVILGKTVSQHQ